MRQEMPGFSAEYRLNDVRNTDALAQRIALGLCAGDAVALEGDLGAGKTTLARGILRALGVTEDVPSPSFTLVQQYETRGFVVFHYDLYRIERDTELNELALEDALSEGVALIEWPERATGLPAGTLHVRLDILSEGARQARIAGPARWAQFLASGRNDQRD